MTTLADGSLVALWDSYGAGASHDVRGRRYTAVGAPLGGEFVVNNELTDTQFLGPSVAALAGGGFVAAWTSLAEVGAGPLEESCAASPTRICLSEGRFSVDVEWQDYAGNTGSGQVVPHLESGASWQHTNPLGQASEALVHWFDTCD